jgi:ER lumen protein retaining receptor
MLVSGALNLFRLCGDLCHLASFLLLFHKLRSNRSVEGLSRKTQELYLAVFCCRYLDLFTFFSHRISILSVYNTVMKIFFIASSGLILHRFQKTPWKATYNDKEDSFRHWLFLALPAFIIALLLSVWEGPMEVLYTFSIILESVTILPQLVMLQRHKNVENLTANFVFALGLYRGFYIVNWIDRYVMDNHKTDTVVWVSGIVQTLIYADFFYYYIDARRRGQSLVLPQ